MKSIQTLVVLLLLATCAFANTWHNATVSYLESKYQARLNGKFGQLNSHLKINATLGLHPTTAEATLIHDAISHSLYVSLTAEVKGLPALINLALHTYTTPTAVKKNLPAILKYITAALKAELVAHATVVETLIDTVAVAAAKKGYGKAYTAAIGNKIKANILYEVNVWTKDYVPTFCGGTSGCTVAAWGADIDKLLRAKY